MRKNPLTKVAGLLTRDIVWPRPATEQPDALVRETLRRMRWAMLRGDISDARRILDHAIDAARQSCHDIEQCVGFIIESELRAPARPRPAHRPPSRLVSRH